jgi:hypothetical protein
MEQATGVWNMEQEIKVVKMIYKENEMQALNMRQKYAFIMDGETFGADIRHSKNTPKSACVDVW